MSPSEDELHHRVIQTMSTLTLTDLKANHAETLGDVSPNVLAALRQVGAATTMLLEHWNGGFSVARDGQAAWEPLITAVIAADASLGGDPPSEAAQMTLRGQLARLYAASKLANAAAGDAKTSKFDSGKTAVMWKGWEQQSARA